MITNSSGKPRTLFPRHSHSTVQKKKKLLMLPNRLLPAERRGSDIARLIHENHSEPLY